MASEDTTAYAWPRVVAQAPPKVCVRVAAADNQRISLRIERPRLGLQDRNAAYAAKVHRLLQTSGKVHTEELRFAALEESIADLSEVVRVCDEHELEFELFSAFDDLLLGVGKGELDRFEDAHALHAAEHGFEPGDGLFAPLDGERSGYVHRLGATIAGAGLHLHVAIVHARLARTCITITFSLH